MKDAFDIHTAQIVNAPDVRSWPITTAMTKVSFDGSVSRFDFTKKDGMGRWPDVRPEGWDGDLQYTIWLFRKIHDRWVGSAFIQFWYGRDGSGDPHDPDVPSKYHDHWFYGTRWAPMNEGGPITPGEQIGFMVTSGNQRDDDGPNSVQERSNIVVVPAADNAVYTFTDEPVKPDPIEPKPDPVHNDDLKRVESILAILVDTVQKQTELLSTITQHLQTLEFTGTASGTIKPTTKRVTLAVKLKPSTTK
jgi:hypothetical protein